MEQTLKFCPISFISIMQFFPTHLRISCQHYDPLFLSSTYFLEEENSLTKSQYNYQHRGDLTLV